MPCLLFVLFSLSASKKSNDRKYHLLIKRNPCYFLGAFFHLLGKLGRFQQKYATLEELKILIFDLLVSRVASYPILGLLLEIYVCISRYMRTSRDICTFRDDLLLKHSYFFGQVI
jgi:hypothetical protein